MSKVQHFAPLLRITPDDVMLVAEHLREVESEVFCLRLERDALAVERDAQRLEIAELRARLFAASEDLLSDKEAATLLGVSPRTLAKWRVLDIGPDYVKLGDLDNGPVRYRREAIESYREARTIKTKEVMRGRRMNT